MEQIYILKIGSVYTATQSEYFFRKKEDAVNYAINDYKENEHVSYDGIDDEMRESFDEEGQYCGDEMCYEIVTDWLR